MVQQIVCGAISGPDHGSDRTLEVGDRDRSLKDTDAVIVSGLFSFSEDSFHGVYGRGRTGPTFSPALFYIGEGPERFEKVFGEIGVVWVVPMNGV